MGAGSVAIAAATIKLFCGRDLAIIAQHILNMCVGGLGMWSNENCKMIPCRGDPDDDQVCCECNQTVRQRLSRRQSPSLTAHPIGHFGLLLVRIEMGKETVNTCVESFGCYTSCLL